MKRFLVSTWVLGVYGTCPISRYEFIQFLQSVPCIECSSVCSEIVNQMQPRCRSLRYDIDTYQQRCTSVHRRMDETNDDDLPLLEISCENVATSRKFRINTSEQKDTNAILSCTSFCQHLGFLNQSSTVNDDDKWQIECEIEERFSEKWSQSSLKVAEKGGVHVCNRWCIESGIVHAFEQLGRYRYSDKCKGVDLSVVVGFFIVVFLMFLFIVLRKYLERQKQSKAYDEYKAASAAGTQESKPYAKKPKQNFITQLQKLTDMSGGTTEQPVLDPEKVCQVKLLDIEQAKYKIQVLKASQEYQRKRLNEISQDEEEQEDALDAFDDTEGSVEIDPNQIEELKTVYYENIEQIQNLLDEEQVYKRNRLKERLKIKRDLELQKCTTSKAKQQMESTLDSSETKQMTALEDELKIQREAMLRKLENSGPKEKVDNPDASAKEKEKKRKRRLLKQKFNIVKEKKQSQLAIEFLQEKKKHRDELRSEIEIEMSGKVKSMSVTKSKNQVAPELRNLDKELAKIREFHEKEAASLEQAMREDKKMREQRLGERLKKRRERVEALLTRKEPNDEGKQLKLKKLNQKEDKERQKLEEELKLEKDGLLTETKMSKEIQNVELTEKLCAQVQNIGDCRLQHSVVEAAQEEAQKFDQDHAEKLNALVDQHQTDIELLEESLKNDRLQKESALQERLRKRREKELASKTDIAEKRLVEEQLKLEEEEEEKKLQEDIEREHEERKKAHMKRQKKETLSLKNLTRISAAQRVKAAKRQAVKQQNYLENMQKEHREKLIQLEQEFEHENSMKESKLQERLRKRREKSGKPAPAREDEDEEKRNMEKELEEKQKRIELIRQQQEEQERLSKEQAEAATVEALAANAAYSNFKEKLGTGSETSLDTSSKESPRNLDQTLGDLLRFEANEFTMDQVYVVEQFAKTMRKRAGRKKRTGI